MKNSNKCLRQRDHPFQAKRDLICLKGKFSPRKDPSPKIFKINSKTAF